MSVKTSFSDRYEAEWSPHLEAFIVSDTWYVEEVAVCGCWDDCNTITECLNTIEYERDPIKT